MGSNCVASSTIGCLFCCQGCNAEKLRNTFTFLPPKPSYVVENGEEGRAGKVQYVSEAVRNFGFYRQAAENADVHFVKTSRGERIPIVWMRGSGKKSPSCTTRPSTVSTMSVTSTPYDDKGCPLVILHCHGNATDIGMMMGPYFEMSRQLGCEIVGVEYSGYGASTGSPSAVNTLADAEAAYNFVVSQGVAPHRIVAYGQSVGSGPALNLAARRQCGGVVLHSPMLSGIKVIDPQPDSCCRPSCVYCCFDFFPNDRLMKTVNCPAFIMHGRLDDIIPFYHGVRLADAAPKHCRWPGYFPRDAGHNDIVEKNATAYFSAIRAFLRSLSEQEDGIRSTSLSPSASGIGRPLQLEMVDLSGGRADGAGTLPYAEPTVGPEDGRYDQLRRGVGGQGGAREVRTAAGPHSSE